SHGVSKSFTHEATLFFNEQVLPLDPGEEVVDERFEDGLAFLLARRRWLLFPRLVEFVELSDSQQALLANGVAGYGGFPEPSPRMSPTGHLDRVRRRGRRPLHHGTGRRRWCGRRPE